MIYLFYRVAGVECDFDAMTLCWHPKQVMELCFICLNNNYLFLQLLLAFVATASAANRDRDRDQPTIIKLWIGGNVV
jgi:hypothetical protein